MSDMDNFKMKAQHVQETIDQINEAISEAKSRNDGQLVVQLIGLKIDALRSL